jgi:hypothetical protein
MAHAGCTMCSSKSKVQNALRNKPSPTLKSNNEDGGNGMRKKFNSYRYVWFPETVLPVNCIFPDPAVREPLPSEA